MLILIADRGPIAGMAIKRALKVIPEVEIIVSLNWKDVEAHLKSRKEVIVVSTHTLSGFRTSSEFAAKVKAVNSDALVFVYNGAEVELSIAVDGYIPACKSGQSVDSVFIPFFTRVVAGLHKSPTQLRLF